MMTGTHFPMTLIPMIALLGLLCVQARAADPDAMYAWQKAGQGPRPVGAGQSFEQNPRAGGLGMELTTDSWPRVFRRAVPYYGEDIFSGIGKYRPQGDFGTIQPAGAGFASAKVVDSSWTHVKLRYEATDPGKSMDATVTRLSPAAVFQPSGEAVTLFGGGKAKPSYVAARAGGEVVVRPIAQVGELPLKGLDRGWLLVWFGKQSNFNSTDFPFATDFRGWVDGPHYLADCPFLVLPASDPAELVSTAGGLGIRFASEVKAFAVLPLFGQLHPKAEDTEKWAAGLPKDVVDACDFWADHLGELPLSAEESYAAGNDGDRVTISTRLGFLRVRQGGKRFAPLPPMLATARAYGLPMKVTGSPAEPIKTSALTPYGPYEGLEVDEQGSVSIEVTGLGKYVNETLRVGPSGMDDPALSALLEGEVDKVLQAGHLAPWYIAMTDYGAGYQYYWRSGHALCWSNPGETLYLLAQALPILKPAQAEKVRQYLKAERQKYPPERIAHTPVAEGARRERYSLDEPLLAEQQKHVDQNNFYLRNKMVPEESLYYLAEYYRAMGEKPSAAEWQAAKAILDPYLRQMDWASLGFFKRPAMGHFMIEGSGGVADANTHFAACVGYIRLARLAGDKDAEVFGLGLLAKAAMLRYGMEKYPHYLADSKLYVLPKEPDWMIKFTRGAWSARLYTYQWTKPEDDVRSIARMDQFGVQFDDVMDWYHGTGMPKLRGLTPELARFLGDRLKVETGAFVGRVAENSPDWYLAWANFFVGAEYFYQQPQESHTQFLARALALKEPGEKLAGYLDVPWMRQGDLYYIHKLAMAIAAERGTEWGGTVIDF